jgi:hypothetical protein
MAIYGQKNRQNNSYIEIINNLYIFMYLLVYIDYYNHNTRNA